MSVPDTSAATGAAAYPSPSTVSQRLQSNASNLFETGSGYINRSFPAEKRQAWKEWLVKLSSENPKMASFLLSQLALSGPPIALFILVTITVVIFALLAGIVVGLLGALLFIVTTVGFALLVLLPVLFFTTAGAVFFWLWAMGTYCIVKWFNEKPIPAIHSDVKGGHAEANGHLGLPGMTGEPLMRDGDRNTDIKAKGTEEDQPEKDPPATVDGSAGPPVEKQRPVREDEQAKTISAQLHSNGQECGPSPTLRKKKSGDEGVNGAKNGPEHAHDAVLDDTKKAGVLL